MVGLTGLGSGSLTLGVALFLSLSLNMSPSQISVLLETFDHSMSCFLLHLKVV